MNHPVEEQLEILKGQALASQAIIDVLINALATILPSLPAQLLAEQRACFDHLPANLAGTALVQFQDRWRELERIANHHLPRD